MKRFLGLVALFSVLGIRLWAQSSNAEAHDVATTWPGIHLKIFDLERIAGNRLLAEVKIYATADAPGKGTLIGFEVPIPEDATPEQIGGGLFRPKPFSLDSAVMTDEQTKQTFTTLKPDPAGIQYIPSTLLTNLHPGEVRIMTIQFPLPPPLPARDGNPPPKQTLSLLLPKATAAITGLSVPPSRQALPPLNNEATKQIEITLIVLIFPLTNPPKQVSS